MMGAAAAAVHMQCGREEKRSNETKGATKHKYSTPIVYMCLSAPSCACLLACLFVVVWSVGVGSRIALVAAAPPASLAGRSVEPEQTKHHTNRATNPTPILSTVVVIHTVSCLSVSPTSHLCRSGGRRQKGNRKRNRTATNQQQQQTNRNNNTATTYVHPLSSLCVCMCVVLLHCCVLLVVVGALVWR